jgi:hypothetical protein
MAVAALAFLPALPVGFLADDFVYIARFREMPWTAWPEFFVREWSGGVWGQPLKELRPFAALSFMIDARLWGGDPAGYRLVNLALHLAATSLVFLIAWHHARARPRPFSARGAALIAGLLFAVHPAHVETVTWITGRADLLGTVAALAFWLGGEMYSDGGSRRAAWGGLVALLVGVFTKEFCLVLPLLLALRWVLVDPRAGRAAWQRRGVFLAGALAVIAVYALARRAAFGADPTTGFFGWNDAPTWGRHAGYFGWLVPALPFTARAEWAALPPAETLRLLWVGLAALAVGGVIFGLVRRAAWAGTVFFGGCWWFATTLGLFVVVYFSPRHLYLPTAGVAVGLGLLLHSGRVRRGLAAFLIAWCLAAHFAALQPWREAGRISREVLAAVNQDLRTAPADTIVLISVPETRGHVLLWAWSSPAALGAPFLERPRTADQVIERPANHMRPDKWAGERRPVETVRAAAAAVAVHVDADGRVHHRLVPRGELAGRADDLARRAAPSLSAEDLTAWIQSCARP